MSPMQQGMFFHDMLTGEHIYYNQVSFDIKGTLNVAVFTESVQLLVDSHEALRMNYFLSEETEEKLPQLSIPEHRKQEVIYCDISTLSEEEQMCKVNATAEECRNRKRNLARGDIMDMHLFYIGGNRYRLLWGCHHIAIDGWCMSLMIKELFEIYDKALKGNAGIVEEVPYSNYLSWLEKRDNETAKTYWENYLKDVPDAYQFPRKTVDGMSDGHRDVMRLTLDEKQMEGLKGIAADTHITVGALIQGIWGMLVCKYSGQSEAIWGSVTSGRSVPISDVEKMVGLFINTMPMILRLEDETPLPEQIKKLGVDLFQAEFNSSVQLSEISVGREALFNHIFAFENLEFADMIEGVFFNGLELDNANFMDRTNYDLTVKAQPTNKLFMDFEYNPSAYDKETIEGMLKAYENLVAQLIQNPQKKVKNFRYMLTKEGMLVALEVTTNKIYHKVSIGFIEGFSGYNDERLEKNVPLLSATEWCTAMADCGFTYPASYPKADKEAEVFEQHVMVAYAAHNKEYCEEAQLMKVLREELPSYMMPERIYSLYEIPLSANAKVDYKQLPYEYCGNKNENQEIVLPQTETEQILHEIIKETLDLDKLSTDVNIFTIGADSLKSISVLTKLKSRGIEVSLSNMYKYSTIQEMAAHIDAERAKDAFQSYEPVEVIDFKPDLEHRFDPFPMSDLQESYYIGAHETEGFNSIPTAGYVEIECRNYNHDRLFKVIGRLMERHDMLRAYIDEDGMQHVLKELPDFEIPVTDLRNIGEEEREQYLRKVRKDMVSTRLDLTKAPLFKCVISQMTDDKSILHIYADGQIMDGWSFQLFYTELGTLYRDPELEIEPLKATFRDYIMYREELKKTDKYKQDREFWLNKIPTLPSAGVLPIKNDITELGEVEGIQVECGIPIEQWRQIEKMSQKFGVSAFSVLMTSFAVSVARWNDKRRFLLNIPEFYRPAFSEDIFKVLGECASFLLFTMEDDPNDTFREKVVKTQQQIMELKDHNNFSGMEITREIYRKNNGYNEVLAPLVFGMLPDAQEFEEQFIEIDKNVLKIIYQENHTSQIWIDVNTCVYSDRIEFNYNSLKGLIDPEILESLATMQKSVLYEAAASEAFWNSRVDIALPQKDKEIINQANATEENLSDKTMPMLLDKAFREYAKEVYLHTDTRDYTYGEIRKMVNALAVKLGEMGIMPGDKVAVHIGKGIEQMVAALTCAYMGYVYTPLEYDYSAELVESALQWIKCQYLLVDTNAAADFAESQVTTLVVDKKLLGKETAAVEYANVKLEDLVAIIHTSGTTGRPKAVMIRQESLVNALLYTNKRFEVIKTDNAFGVTNPSHDMSMYDIFGMAICGAAVTVPQEKFAKDPEVWIKLMRQHKVTIWNSVPAIQEMLMEAVTKEDASYIENLRLVMLGGDYIKPGVLLKLRAVNSDVKMISVGGPTETTLWNIMHEIVEDDLSKDVIPYGKPIANNRYYILNENKKQLPVGVTGTLYCAGIGVANGYCEDEERTGDKFIIWEETGERIYNTGDRGHYREDGTILFDGRDDEQVKINGKRIELVAIESEALAVEKVKGVAAIKAQDNQLVLFYVSDGLEVEDELRGYLMSKLPAYMVPKKYVAIDEIPITINAKVDKKSLAKLYAGRKKEVAPRISATESDVLENILKEKFCELLDLKMDEIDLDSDFFAMGGNSLIAMKLLSQLRENFDVEITLTDLFMTSTIREMKELLEEKNAVLVD